MRKYWNPKHRDSRDDVERLGVVFWGDANKKNMNE